MKSPSKIGCSRDEQLLYAMAEAGSEVPTQDMMYTPLQMVREFSSVMDQPLDQPWPKDADLENLRWDLISEEYGECCDESSTGNRPASMLKELADLVYVCFGYAATYGWDLDTALERVHASNMSKLGDDGLPIKNAEGKVIKGPNYQYPDLNDLVETTDG